MTQKAQTMGFLPGDDPEAVEANRRYQEALNKLTQSLDTRKNRLFDPVWLAAAQGFLAPGAPDFFESLGRVAKNVGEAQTAQEKENRDIAQMQLDVAGRGLEMQRQKSLQALAARQMQGRQTGEPSGALPGGQRGFQIAPPDAGRMTGEQYYALAVARGVPPDEAMRGAAQIDKENIQVREGGVFNIREGRFYSSQYKEVPFQIGGKTYNLPEGVALELSHLARIGDVEGFNRESRRAIREFQGSPAAAQQGAPVAPQPAAAPTGQPAARPAAGQSAAPQAVAPQAAAQPSLPAAPVVAPAAPPTSEAPAQAANLVGGIFSAPTKNAEDMDAIERAVEYYKNNVAVASGATLNRGQPFAPEVLQQAMNEAVKTLERLNQRYGMRLVPPQAGAAQPAARPVEVTRPSAASPAAQQVAPPTVAQASPAAAQPAAAAPARTSALRSQEDIDAEKRRIEIEQTTAKARAEAEVKSEIESRSQISENAKKAREITATANVLRRMADAPDFSKMTGILNNDKISSGLAMLVRDGIGGRSISVGIPAIEDVMRNAGLNHSQQARYRTFLMYTAQMNLAAENSMKGSTTERERLILGNATISPQDTRETVRVKADILNLKAQFDKRVANAFEDAKMTPKEFFRSEVYEKMYGTYLENLTSIAAGEKMLPSPGQSTRQGAAPPARQGTGQQGIGRARDTLNELLNRRP